jgi:hypothetical protein
VGVIGRLDDQVWKTIIEPIARRREREAQECEREEREAAREEEARAEEKKEEKK